MRDLSELGADLSGLGFTPKELAAALRGEGSEQSPYVAIANRQAEIMMRIASEFGFTPASRGRIAVAAPQERTLFDPAELGDEH